MASPLIGDLFHDSRVALVAAATSGLLVLHACSSVPDALMQRAFQFKRRIIVDPAIFAVVRRCVNDVRSLGIWRLGDGHRHVRVHRYRRRADLVAGEMAAVPGESSRSVSGARWRASRSRCCSTVSPNVSARCSSRSLVGRQLGTGDLGQYRYAYRIASMPSMAVIQICSYVLFPAFSRISGDPLRFREAFLRALGWIWFAALPAGMLLVSRRRADSRVAAR